MKLPSHYSVGMYFLLSSVESVGFGIPDAFLSPYFCNFVPDSSREMAVGIFLLIHE